MFGPAAAHVVDTLRAAGIHAATDPADLNTPGVWVTPESWARARLDRTTIEVTLTLTLVTGSKHQPLADLDTLAGQVDAAGIDTDTVTAVTVTLPNHHPAGLPGYQTTTTLEITEE